MARVFRSLLVVLALAIVVAGIWWTHARGPQIGSRERRGRDRAWGRAHRVAALRSLLVQPLRPERSAATDLVALLTQARLVRVNRATDDLEPWLAESWTTSADGLTFTLKLRQALFSDGVPFTADDVLFSFQAAYDDRVHSPLKTSLEVWRAAAEGLRSRSIDGGDPVPGPFRGGTAAAGQPADSAQAQTRGRPRCGQARRRVDACQAARYPRRSGPVRSDGAHLRPAPRLRAKPALLPPRCKGRAAALSGSADGRDHR